MELGRLWHGKACWDSDLQCQLMVDRADPLARHFVKRAFLFRFAATAPEP